MSHKDVYLEFFKRRKHEILSLRSGDTLIYEDYTLYTQSTRIPVARLSMKMQGAINEWQSRGYKVTSAIIRFIVAWRPKDAPKAEKETAVIIADLTLKSTPELL